jgi:peptidyl-prolyl cis-trans isomerase C
MFNKKVRYVISRWFILSLFICIAAIGCQKGNKTASSGKSAAGPDEAIATVNGEKILKSDLDAILDMSPDGGGMHAGGSPMSDEEKKEKKEKIIEQMIDGEVLYQASKATTIEDLDKKVDEEYQNIIRQYGSEEAFVEEAKKNNLTVDKVKRNLRKNISIKTYIDNEVIAKIEVTEESAKQYYESNKKEFESSEEVKASHILCKIPEGATQEQKDEVLGKIKRVQERLKAGEKFEDLAKEVSDCPSSQKGGDLGFFTKGRMVKNFEDTAFGLEKGKSSDIIETQFGYHIIKVVDKKKTGIKAFEEVKPLIENNMKREEYQTRVTKLIQELKEKAKIEIFE